MKPTWLGLTQFDCFPYCSCEVMQEGCIICQPFAFWSSLAYLLAALWIWLMIKQKDEELKLWCYSLVIVAIGSFFAHASYTHWAMALDFAAILNLHLLFLMRRFVWSKMPTGSSYLWVTVIIGILVCGLYFLGRWQQTLLALFIFGVGASELLSRVKIRFARRDRNFFYCFTLMAVMYAMFLFDHTDWLCSSLPIPPHTLWHLGSSISVILFSRWYFKDRLDIGNV